MILALVHKKGLWSRAWRSIFGDPEDLDGEWEDEELDEMKSMAVMTGPSPIDQTVLTRPVRS
jgi:protoheme IX farnesyltransferase